MYLKKSDALRYPGPPPAAEIGSNGYYRSPRSFVPRAASPLAVPAFTQLACAQTIAPLSFPATAIFPASLASSAHE
jgi:hypothetical protein